jgi:putative hydrolase of the HAD superfamily
VPSRAVLFDLDDTLFDHRGTARAALADVHRRHAAAAPFDDLERQHMHHLEVLHLDVLAGRLSIDDARRERFRRVFGAMGVSLDAAGADQVASDYRRAYMAARRALDGAAALLAAVRPHARIAVVSNNLVAEQRDKLEFCGLAGLVDALIVSEEVGVSKPDPEIFRVALDRVGVESARTVMLGDSWAADIVGATRAGIRPVWFNPRRERRPEEPRDVTEVFSLAPEHALPVLLARAGVER